MAQVGTDHVRRPGGPGDPRRPGPQRPADPAAARPRRLHRHAEVRLRRGPPVLERASARETATRVALGTVASAFLKQLGIELVSHTVSIASVAVPEGRPLPVPDDVAGPRRRSAALLRPRNLRRHGRRGRRRAQGRRNPRRRRRGPRLRTAAGTGQLRPLGPAPRLAPGRRPDGHPGDQGRRGRRRLPHRRPAAARPPTTRSSRTPTAGSSARPTAPAASKAA